MESHRIGPFATAYFPEHTVFKACPCYSRYQSLFLRRYYSTACIYHVLLIHSSIGGRLVRLHILTIVNNVNVGLQISIRSLLSIPLGVHLEMELLGHLSVLKHSSSCLNFRKPSWGPSWRVGVRVQGPQGGGWVETRRPELGWGMGVEKCRIGGLF